MAVLESDVALVTGAGRNIGRSIALELGASGATVAVNDVQRELAEGTVSRIEAEGGTALLVEGDISDESNVRTVIGNVERGIGPLSILINNAAIRDSNGLFETDVDTFDRIYAVNLRGLFLVTREAARSMRLATNPGRIVSIGSTSGRRGRRGCIAYATTKSAVYNFTRSIARELAEFGIRANSVTPTRTGHRTGDVRGERPDGNMEVDERIKEEIPLGRLGAPVDIARAVEYLVSTDSEFITGTDLLVDGGRSA